MNMITILLLGGVALLLINIIYGIVRARRGQVKAGWLTVSIALVACAMIGIGSVARITAPVNGFAGTANRGNRQGNVAGSTNSGATDGVSPTAAVQSGSNANTQGLRNVSEQGNAGNFQQDRQNGNGNGTGATTQTDPTAISGTPAADSTPAHTGRGNRGNNANGATNAGATGNNGANTNGDPGAASTPSGKRGFRQNGQTGQNNASVNGAAPDQAAPTAVDDSSSVAATPAANPATNGGSNNAAANTGAAFNPNDLPLSLQIVRFTPQIEVAGAVIGILLALVLYRIEKKRVGFTAGSSRGLLNAGAGVFMIVAALVIPIIPTEITSASNAQAARSGARAAAAVTRVAMTATPSPTPQPTSTPTLLPTFTPVVTDMPIEMPTEIAYAAMLPTATATTLATDCTVTANNNLNLRSDPSTDNIALGKAPIPTGSVLRVLGKSKDGKWWQVSYNDGTVNWTGWVSASFTKADSKCSSVPVTQ